MKHCFTDCLIKYDDEYRTRYDCQICKKIMYQLKHRGSVESHKDSRSSMLLVDGTPMITCAWCNQTDRLHDAKNIRIFIKWEEVDQVYVWIDGIRTVKARYRPKIKTALGCRYCVQLQEMETRHHKKPHCFGLELKVQPETQVTVPNSTIYAPKVDAKIIWDGTGYLTTEDNVRLTEYYGPNVE